MARSYEVLSHSAWKCRPSIPSGNPSARPSAVTPNLEPGRAGLYISVSMTEHWGLTLRPGETPASRARAPYRSHCDSELKVMCVARLRNSSIVAGV